MFRRQPDYILCGDQYLEEFANYAVHYGDVALLLTDKRAEDMGIKKQVVSALDDMGLRLIARTLAGDWPRLNQVKEFWADLDAEYEPNIVISLGDAPTIHFAKALSLIAPYKGHVRDLFLGKAEIQLVLPHLTIPLLPEDSRENEMAMAGYVSIYDADGTLLKFTHRELVPKLVGYQQLPMLQKKRQVS